jgi:hypothetical protein
LGYAGGFVIRSFSDAPAFRAELAEINRTGKGNIGYYWKRRSTGQVEVIFNGACFAEAKNNTEALAFVVAHAKRDGTYYDAPDLNHYYSFRDDFIFLYIDGRFSKKSKSQACLKAYVEATAWLRHSGLGHIWIKK